jgi:uncharacterized Zn finger protein
MGYWDDDDDDGGYGWRYYPKSRPKRVEGGIKTRKERGAIGETWWSKRWLHALEALNMGARLSRGRSYARQGQILSIDIQPGVVHAKVQGSRPRPYTIEIRLQQLSEENWERVTDAMAAQALFAAKLLAGEMPNDIEEAFRAVNLSLFPTNQSDLNTDCSCPDWANPCKHIAAVYYILAERFDEDPFLIFKLRGRSKEAIIEALRKKRSETLPAESAAATQEGQEEEAPEAVLRLEDHLSTFWQADEALQTFAVNPRPPEVDKAVLKRLGNGPFSVGDQNISAILSKVYDVVREAAQRKLPEE